MELSAKFYAALEQVATTPTLADKHVQSYSLVAITGALNLATMDLVQNVRYSPSIVKRAPVGKRIWVINNERHVSIQYATKYP